MPWKRKRWIARGLALGVLACSASVLALSPAVAQNRVHSNHEMDTWEHVTRTASGMTVLKCPGQMLPIGLEYVKGKAVDSLHMVCGTPRPISGTNRFSTLSGQRTVVSAGGQGGTGDPEKAMTCPEGMVLSGVTGSIKLWGNTPQDGPWLLASIGLECRKLAYSNGRWRLPESQYGGFDTPLSKGEQVFIWAENDPEKHGLRGLTSSDPNLKPFGHHCPRTPLEGFEVALADYTSTLGFTFYETKIIYALRWTCF